MVTQFKVLIFRNLPNGAHYDYCVYASSKFAAAPSILKPLISAPVAEFNTWLAKETALMEWVRKSALTKQIAEADNRLDHDLVALNAQTHALEYSHTPAIAEAATRVYIMLMSYGKVYDKSYDNQAGDVRAILEQLAGAYAADVTALGLTPLVTELQSAFTEFRNLLAQRSTDELKKPTETFPAVRRGIEEAYHQVVFTVNGLMIVGPKVEAEALINSLNGEIERLNAEFHRAKKDLSVGDHTVIEPIDTQPYMENRPATPVPAVHYREDGKETVRLSLGKDFSVTYKNNDKVGMAELTIHGKGKYTGRYDTTFHIVPN
jgi:hypothetical protein